METLITDFSIAEPGDRIIDSDPTTFGPIAPQLPGSWRLIDFEAEHFSGKFLQASDREAATLTVPLGCDGWHAVSIGMCGSGVKQGPASIEVRLTGDEHWQFLRADGSTGREIELVEEPWIMADLTGRALEVRFPQQPGPVLARLFSVRAVSMTDAHVARLQQDPARPLMMIIDGNLSGREEPGPHMMEGIFEPFRDSPWSACCYGVGGADLVNYDTKVGTIVGEGSWDMEEGYGGSFEVVTEMIRLGLDPMQLAVDTAHRSGHPLLAYIRNQLWICEPPLDQKFRSKFYSEHPEYCCVEADGVVDASKLSIAFPEVRRQLNGIMRECLERGADGVSLCFARGFPLVRYEQPVLDRYRERHGGDARELADTDERLRGVWSELVTEWIREIRELLDSFGPSAMYERRKLAVIGGPNQEWHLGFGIDYGEWGRERLVDIVAPYPRGIELEADGMIEGVAEIATALQGTEVELAPSLGSYADHRMTVREVRARADAFYRAGASGLSRWDTSFWLARLQMESAEVQRLWVEHYMPPTGAIVSTAGLNRQRFNPRIGV